MSAAEKIALPFSEAEAAARLGISKASLTRERIAGNVRAAVPGWAYLKVYTQGLTLERCLDLTPAAQAAARIIRAGESVQTTADELADRL